MKTWTFILEDGPPVQITLPENPPLNFQGKRCMWKIYTSDIIADDALRILQNLGVSVKRYTEITTDEMDKLRNQII